MDERNGYAAKSSIECLLDANSFVETGCLVHHDSAAFGIDKQADGDGVIAGYGTIGSVPVYIYAQDMSAFDGSLGAKNAEKIARIYDAAVKNGVPVISVLNSAGARLLEGVAALDGYARVIKSAAKASGVVPRIAVAAGAAIGATAIMAETADFVFAAEDARIGITSDEVRRADGGEGVKLPACDYDFKGTLPEIAKSIEKLLALLPSNSLEDAPIGPQSDDFNRAVAASKDARELIKNAADFGEFFELRADHASNMITGLARFGGFTAGVIANAPGETEGRLDTAALDKAAGFISFLDSFGIPVISLVDTKGFVYCDCEEKKGIAKAAARLAYAYASADSAIITAVTGSAIGGAYAVMGSRELGADMVFAAKDAVIAPVDAALASVLFYDELEAESREDKMAEYRKKYSDPMEAAYNGSVDRVIDLAELRQMLISALIMQATKNSGEPLKRHGNMPL